MKSVNLRTAMAAALLVFSVPSTAGIYSDDLSRCLVESSSSTDKMVLVRWMYTAMSLHPAVKPLAQISAAQVDQANKEVADLFVTLLTETCNAETRKAIQYEGPVAMQSSFEVFGKVAAGELFSNPDVAAGMAGLDRHMDKEKLSQALGLK